MGYFNRGPAGGGDGMLAINSTIYTPNMEYVMPQNLCQIQVEEMLLWSGIETERKQMPKHIELLDFKNCTHLQTNEDDRPYQRMPHVCSLGN